MVSKQGGSLVEPCGTEVVLGADGGLAILGGRGIDVAVRAAVPPVSPDLAARVKGKVEKAMAYRTYQGSKNIAKRMLNRLGATSPWKSALRDQARVDAYEATLEDLTQCIIQNGEQRCAEYGLAELALNSHGYRRWLPTDLSVYRERRAG